MTDLLSAEATPVPAAAIHDVIDGQRVRAVYQPLVLLAAGKVIGYEALARGPVGTELENPMDLLAAATQVGRLGDLDWACRAAAVRGALAGALGRDLTLFVNLEPDTLGQSCPEHLLQLLARAGRELRIVAEVTERSLARDPAGLLEAVARVRAAGFGVALDDVGADPASLALLPFVEPDVVKLDLRLVQSRNDADVGAIANAVRAYAERTGAAVLAEGIETSQHVEVAKVLGATLGQGWYFGRPGPLPAELPAPVSSLQLLDTVSASASATPFEIVSASRPATRTTKRLLIPMSHHLESRALVDPEPPVILSCFQRGVHFTFATRERYRRLVPRSAMIVALGVDLDTFELPEVRGADLEPGDRLEQEWNVVVVGPHFAAALVARDCGDTGSDLERRFDYVITHDRDLVVAAARSLLHWVTPAG